MNAWKECQLESVVEQFIDYRGKTPVKTAYGIPLITAKLVKNGRILEPNEFIANSDYTSWMRRGFPKENDVVLTTEAPLGEVALLKNKDVALAQRIILIRGNEGELFNPFLKYYLQSSMGQEELHIRSSGTTVTGIKSTELKKITITIPEYSEQKAIATVFSSFDDKIDLLHRQNVTLEAMAEALFRQWCVMEAKEEWEEKPLLYYIKIVGGGTPKTSVREYWDGSIPWLSAGDIAGKHKAFALQSVKMITEIGLENSSAKLLPQFSTILTARGTVGKFCLLGRPMAYSQTNYGILPAGNHSYFFTFLLVDHVIKELQMAAYGSVFDTITTQTFEEIKIALPEDNVILKFEGHVENLFSKMLANQTQIRTLEKLRNTLLPKLMSGEVRVEY
jgi:type I restriction enzyme S subunit